MSYLSVRGRNFSGRTNFLRQFAGLEPERGGAVQATRSVPFRGKAAFVGNDPAASFLGTAPSVSKELQAQNCRARIDPPRVAPIVEYLRSRSLLNRSPYLLSGGEQTLVAIAAALISMPQRASIDTCTEQLAPNLARYASDAFRMHGTAGGSVAICDNREGAVFHHDADECPVLDTPAPAEWRIDADRFDTSLLSKETLDVSIQSVSHSFGSHAVLKSAQAKISAGTIYHLKGENGAGKSTLAKILSGLIRPNELQATLGNTQFVPASDPARVFAYHFQNPDQQFFRTSIEAELLASNPRNRPLLDSVVETFHLKTTLELHPLDLPYVMRKRVALACALLMDRPWYILDEPTLGQDETNTQALSSLFCNLARIGKSLIIITHNDRLIESLCPHVLELRDGRLFG
jgi:energy-coupling factor transporter ATP-binding protein EcfA2